LFAQFFAFQQFGDDEGRPLVIADVINRQNVRVIEGGSGAGFLLEATQPISVSGKRS